MGQIAQKLCHNTAVSRLVEGPRSWEKDQNLWNIADMNRDCLGTVVGVFVLMPQPSQNDFLTMEQFQGYDCVVYKNASQTH